MVKRLFWWIRVHIKLWLHGHFYLIEFCKRCGQRQPLLWYVADELWQEVTGQKGGVYCPECFDALAESKGILLQWSAKRMIP